MIFKRLPPYSQDEISQQIGDLAHLNKLRDAALQKALTYKDSDVKQQRYLEETDRYTDAIEIAQHVLDYMLSEVVQFNDKQKQKGK